jgi:hypothetical protein
MAFILNSWEDCVRLWFTLCSNKLIPSFLYIVIILLYFSVLKLFLILRWISWMTHSFWKSIIHIIACGYYQYRVSFNVVVYNPVMKPLTIMYVLYHINTIKLNLIMHAGKSVLFMADALCDKQVARKLLNIWITFASIYHIYFSYSYKPENEINHIFVKICRNTQIYHWPFLCGDLE